MQTEKILVPVDTARCYPEVFGRVNTLGSRTDVTVVLLHVVTLNITAPGNQVYERLAQEALWHLEQMARQFMRPGIATLLRVRFGDPVEQILAEAEAQQADLIIVPVSHKPERKQWPALSDRLLGRWSVGTSQKLVRRARCPVLVVPAAAGLASQGQLGIQAQDIDSALRYLDLVSGTGVPFNVEREEPLAQADREKRLAA